MRHRHHLPQLDGGLFLTDGGIETTLIFHEGLELPAFLEKLRQSEKLNALGFGQLLLPDGAIKRDVWESNFGIVVVELGLGRGPAALRADAHFVARQHTVVVPVVHLERGVAAAPFGPGDDAVPVPVHPREPALGPSALLPGSRLRRRDRDQHACASFMVSSS